MNHGHPFAPGRPPRAARVLQAATALGLVLALLGAAAAAAGAAACPGDAQAAAALRRQRQATVRMFLADRYATAYGRFALLAGRDDTAAAWVALAISCPSAPLTAHDLSLPGD